jgi:hypothetical protein
MRSSILRVMLLLALFGLSCAPPRDDSPAPEGTPEHPEEPVKKPVVNIPSSILPRLNLAIDNVANRQLRTTSAFWTVFHGILGLGPEITLLDEETGKQIKAIDQISTGIGIRGLVFIPSKYGLDVETQVGTGVGQGHQDQFVAEMVEWGIPASRPVTLNGAPFTFADFFSHSKMRASLTKNQELSWAIVIIGKIFGTDHEWTNMFGERLSYEDVVRYELNQPIDNAACGGTHRLFGLSWANQLHRAKGGQPTGVWKDCQDKLALYKSNARKFQHADGSFSTAYVSKAEDSPVLQARIGSTGHTLEWLALELSDEEIRQGWVEQAASALSQMIIENQGNPLDSGALYHAVHGLYMYRARVCGVPGPAGLHTSATTK